MAQRQQPTPLSLNQRLLLSASHSKPLPENSAKQEARKRFNQNDFVPTFSVISDSDSSPSPVRLSSKGTGEAENDDQANIKDTSAFQNDDVPSFCAIADFSPESAKSSHFGEKEIDDQLKINISAVGNDDVPNFSAIADFSPHSTKSSLFEKEIGEPKNGIQEKLSNSTEDSFDYQCSGIVEKEIDQPKSETQGTETEDQSDSSHDSDTSSPLGEKESDKLQEEFSDPPEDFLNTQCSGTVGKVIDQPKSATEVDPQLSGIDDSSSPLSGDMKPSKGIDEDCELSQEGRDDYKKKSNCTSNLPEEEKITKVKIKGRRRLCKISEDNNGSEETKLNDNKESRHVEITDFDSPPQVKNAVRNEQGGSVNEIRDILHDLSSRLEILSIEKKRAPKPSDPLKKDEFPEYHDADSSFSLSSGSSSDSSKVSKTEGEIHKKGLKIDLESESENDCVVRDFNGTRSFGGASKRKEVKQVVGKSKPMIDSFSSYNMMEEEDNNDRHGESKNNSVVREFNGTRSFNGAPKRKEVKQVVGKSQAMMNSFSSYNMLEKEDGNDRDGESENDCLAQEFSGTRLFSGAPKRKEVKQVFGKSQPMWNSFSSYNTMEEEGVNGSDDDCVVVGNRSAVNQVERHIRKSRPEPECLDDFESGDFVEEHILTLSGPKFTFRLPGNVAKILYPHQRDGLKWLWSLHCQGKGGLLGDDMGLGKTMQICGFLAGLFYSKLVKRVMIVAPKTLLPHWIKELTAVGLSDKIREYFAPNAKLREYELQYVLQDKGILLTTYDIVRNNVKSLCGDHRYLDRDEELTWDYMILDEGHLIKNPSTQRAKSLHEIPCAHRIIISGTPLQNNLKELWALFNFCCPGLLGDKQWFKEKYEHFILRGNDKNAYDRDKRIGSAVAKELREHIQPYFLRRLKSEVFSEDSSTSAKLSKKNEIIVWLKLTNCQRQLYTAFLRSEIVLSAFDSSPLAALTILKKICDHPLLLTKRAAEEVLEEMDSTSNQEDHTVAERLVMQMANVTEKLDVEETHDVSCKITFILALLDKLIPAGHNVLIFSQTRKMLNLIQDSLMSNNFQFMRIDGTTKATDRLKIVNDFQEGRGAPIFLLTSQVGGLGLTLTRADRVIVVDPAWNPSTDNQSVDRAYRIGQTKDVVVYRLMTCATVEEKIYRKQVYKGGLFKTATEHKEQIRYFSQQDLRELFSLPKDGGFDISLTQKQLNEEHDHENKMEEALKAHVKFLETLGIAGVSQHSLLFSKTAPAPVVQDEDRVEIARARTFVGNSSSYSSVERAVDAEQYAFKPKDVKVQEKSAATRSGPTESDIKDRIGRLYQIFANKDMISRLPDKGERIQTQIAELHKELEIFRMEKENKNEVIDLDDISGRFHRVVNV